MNPHPSCPRCGRASLVGNSFCSACGTNLSSQGKKNTGVKLVLAAVALFAGLVWIVAIFAPGERASNTSQEAVKAKARLLSSADTPATATAPLAQSQELTGAQHLSEAKRALAEGYKPNKDPKKTSWGEVAAAKWHLKAIAKEAPEYREAQELLKEVARRERQIEIAPATLSTAEVAEAAVETGAADEEEAEAAASTRPSIPERTSPSTSTTARQAEPESRTTAPPAGGFGSTSSSDYYTNSRGIRVQRPTFSENVPRQRHGPMQGRLLQLQHEPTRDVLTPRRGGKVALS